MCVFCTIFTTNSNFFGGGGGTLTFHVATASKQANVHNFYFHLLLST